jgi:hypothetical protein
MINHIRTLLLNRAALPAATVAGDLEEFIEPGFRAVALTGQLSRMHVAIMPTALDRLTANAYVFSYMQLMHQPDFRPQLLALDPRITYDLESRTLFNLRRTTELPAVPDYVTALERLRNASLGGLGSPLLNSGDWEGKDAVVYAWFNRGDSLRQLTAGLYLMVRCMEAAR